MYKMQTSAQEAQERRTTQEYRPGKETDEDHHDQMLLSVIKFC